MSGCLLEDPEEFKKAHDALENEKAMLQTELGTIQSELAKCRSETGRLSPVKEEKQNEEK